MRRLFQFVVRFLKGEDGPTAVEYAIMLAFIITVCAASVATLGSNTKNSLTKTNSTAFASS
jgi:pilus assembly protein Flp/PilA